MRLVFAMVLAGLVALPESVNAQDVKGSASPKEPAPEPVSEAPALRLELDRESVKLAPSSYRDPAAEEREEMARRVKRANIGFGASAAVAGASGVLVFVAALGAISTGVVRPVEDTSGDWIDPALIAAGALLGAGVVGMITAGVISRRRSKKLSGMWAAHYEAREEVSVDTSDDAFLVIVTRRYDGDELTGATVFIRHKESGRHANPDIGAAMIDSLDNVIREHKDRLLSGE